MNKFFQGQYDYIYFFYGLSFLFLFIVCFALEKGKLGKLPWLLLGLFGLMHGLSEWMEIYAINAEVGQIFTIAHLAVLGISYLFLFEFARQGFWRIRKKSFFIYPVISLLIFFSSKYGLSGLGIALRCFLGLPAGLFAAWVIYKISKSEPNDRKVLFILSLVMAFYALMTGLIVPKTDFLLAKWINVDSFYHFFGFPVQFARGITALLLAVTLWYYSPTLTDVEYHPRKYALLFRPTKWIIIFSLVTLVGLGWVFTNYLDYYAGIQIIKNTKANRNSPLNKLIGELTRLEQAAYYLSKFPVVKTALTSSNPDDLAKAVALMSKYKDRCGAFDCLLLNTQGLIVISTDGSLPEGKTNRSQVSLSYFKEALKGNTGYYFIPGSTYNERVYYVGFPLEDGGKIIGVVAFKKIISAKPVMRYRLLSIAITMFICVITMIFFVILRRKENLLELVENAHDRLQTVDKMKTDFISIVSHELRTPLTSIKNAVTILLKADPGKRISESNQKELLEIILANTNRQTRMINDLLDVSKIEAGVLDVCMESLNVVDVAKEVCSCLEPGAKEKGISLNISDTREPFILEFDPEHLRRILTNLIINAINFTPNNGEVSVKIKDEEGQALFTISDTGVGICDEDKPKLFNKFYRAADAHARQKGGSGLGLVIAKGLVELQGGKIWVDSVFGKGSSFYFTIPIKKN